MYVLSQVAYVRDYLWALDRISNITTQHRGGVVIRWCQPAKSSTRV